MTMKDTRKYKQTELGLLPEDWEVAKLGDKFRFISNNTFSREFLCEDGEIKNIHYGDVLIKYGSTLDVSQSDIPTINSELLPSYQPKCFAEDGDIIIADTAEDETVCKATELWNIGGKRVVAGLHTMWCRPAQNTFAIKFLGYFMNTSLYHNQVLPLIQGIKVSSVSKSAIQGTWLCIPPIEEQRRIASALTSIDNLIDSLDRLIAKKRDIKQGAMQQLLSGKKRLKGFTDKWETLLFKDIFTFLTTNTFARELLNIKGEIKNIHYGDILTNYCEILDVSKTDLPYIDSNKVTRYNPVILAKDGDIIIADTAEDEIVCKATEIYNIGNAKVVSGLHTMWCRPKNNIFAPKFLGYYLNSSMFHDQILPLIQGIKVSSVSKNSIKNTWISFPTISEQQAIASVLTSMDNELSALDAKCRKYEQIKQGMMQQLLTGRIRLN